MKENRKVWLQRRKRIFEIIEVGTSEDLPSRAYDIASVVVMLVNVAVTVLYTFDEMELACGPVLLSLEALSVACFALDYCLRLWTANFLYPNLSEGRAVWKYSTSLTGIIDLLSFLPYYLPVFFPSGTAVFRMFRVVRIFRLFQINAYYDSLNVIVEVLNSKRQQLMSSVFIIFVMMLASSLCMYSVEHTAQPEIFQNAFSGIWWAMSTLLTVGYGDIYPVTTLGKLIGIIIAFLGVAVIAIPTSIISAGFVDQYSRLKRISEYASEENVHFIKVSLHKNDTWVGKTIMDLQLPHGVIVAMVRRGQENIVPRGDVELKAYDTVVLGAEALKDSTHIDLKEIVLRKQNPWNGQAIRDLDISRQTMIVMVKRNDTMLVPKGSLVLLEGDQVVLYTQEKITNANVINI